MLMEKLPSFTLQDENDEAVSTDEYIGKKTLIFMWASW